MSNLPMTKSSGDLTDMVGVIRPLSCVLAQGSKCPPEEQGKFKFSTGEIRDELKQVVVLAVQPSRVLYGKIMGGDPRCASDDGLHVARRIKDPVNQGCNGCPMSLWSGDIKDPALMDAKVKMSIELGKAIKDKPLCRSQYMLLVLDQGSFLPYWLAIHDAQMKVFKTQFVQQLFHRGMKFPYMATIDIKVQQKSGAGNSWFECYFSNMTKLTEFAEYQAMAEKYIAAHGELMDQEFTERMEDKDEPIPF